MASSNGAPYHLPAPKQGDGKLDAGAVDIQSNIRDVLTFYKNVMLTEQKQM